MLPLLAGLRVVGPRTRPDRALADKAYSSRAIRAHLRARGIGSVIPEPHDQESHRRRRGSSGGRQVSYGKNAYRGRKRHRTCLQPDFRRSEAHAGTENF